MLTQVFLQKETTTWWENYTECSQQCRPARIQHWDTVWQTATQQQYLALLSLLQPGLKWFCPLSPQAKQRNAVYCSSKTSLPDSCADHPPHSKRALKIQLQRYSENLGEKRASVTHQARSSAATCPISHSAHSLALQSCFCKYTSNSWWWSIKISPKGRAASPLSTSFLSPLTTLAMTARPRPPGPGSPSHQVTFYRSNPAGHLPHPPCQGHHSCFHSSAVKKVQGEQSC